MSYHFLKVHLENQIGWLEYNRPPINAFNWEMSCEVFDAFEALLKDSHVRVIVFASALEEHFSVGADLQEFKSFGQEKIKQWVIHFHNLVNKMRQSNKPLLAAIHGTAVGGGLEITLHCDVRFASQTAQFGQPEINIGFIPPIATTQSLARLLGRTRAIRYLYEGTMVDAKEAQAMGMIDLLVPPERLRKEVREYALMLTEKPPEALADIRRTITLGGGLTFEEGMQLEQEAVIRLVGTPNFKEGVQAFLEKRKPNWV